MFIRWLTYIVIDIIQPQPICLYTTHVLTGGVHYVALIRNSQ